MRVAAIDQGTTSTRVLVLEEGGAAAVVRSLRHEQRHPRPGWVEHEPEELLANIRSCLEAAGPVDAIAIDNQGESCLAWDRDGGRPLSPVIVWQDARTTGRIEQLKAEGVEALTLERAGLPLDPYFSASKLAWILENVPEARRALARGRLGLGTTDAYFLDRLAGTYATDLTTASRTSLLDLETGRWDPELCAAFKVPIEALPEIRATVGRFGTIGGAPVLASVVDQQAALYGHGCRQRGDAKITFGTGAFALAVTGAAIARAPERGLLPTVAWRIGEATAYALDGGVYNAGSAIDWARRLGLFADLAELDALNLREPAIARPLAFVPALSGLACPHWDRRAAGLWIELGLETQRLELAQAVLEGVALRTAEVIQAMAQEVPIAAPISIDGGLTRSSYFVQFLADVLEHPVIVPDLDELTAYGAALLARRGADGAEPKVGRGRVIEPRRPAAAWRERFADAVRRAKDWRRDG